MADDEKIVDVPEVTDEEQFVYPEDEQDELDDEQLFEDEVKKSNEQYRQYVESIGGKFDSDGNFVGWNVANEPEPKLSNPDEDIDEAVLAKITARIAGKLAPATSTVMVDSLIANNPMFKDVRGETLAILKNMPAENINEASVQAAAYMALGAKAPVLIANAKKEAATVIKNRSSASSAVIVEGGGEKPTGRKTIVVTPEIESTAKAFGLDPKVLASKYYKEKQNG